VHSTGEYKRILLRSAIKRLADADHTQPVVCPDCGKRIEFFQTGSITKAVADRFNENRGYGMFNICWRCKRCNETHVPKLEGDRTCECCKKTFKNCDFIRAAMRARGVRGA